jgi:G3E family GTPase
VSKTPIPALILSGYLGAGKTTLINQLLQGDHGRRITVLVNDFGSVNIDASLIKNRSGDTISLSNGCACCSIGDSLLESASDVANGAVPPDLLVIEASGAAEPARMSRLLLGVAALEPAHIVTVVNALQVKGRLSDKFVGRLVKSQIDAADLVYLNRLPDVADSFWHFWNAKFDGSSVVQTSDHILDLLGRSPRSSPNNAPALVTGLETFTVDLPALLSRKELDKLLARLPVQVHRAKGYVHLTENTALQSVPYLVQVSDGTVQIEKSGLGSTTASQLVLIGVFDVAGKAQIQTLLNGNVDPYPAI